MQLSEDSCELLQRTVKTLTQERSKGVKSIHSYQGYVAVMDVGNGGTGGTLPHFFKNSYVNFPFSAYTVPFLLVRVPLNAGAPTF